MSYAMSWSGGKDCTLALHRTLDAGLDVRVLFNIYEGTSGRVRFHGVRRELIAAQAAALGLELVQAHTHPDDFEAVFARVLEQLAGRGIEGLIFGNIHLSDVRAWYETRTRAAGFDHLEPLWGEDPAALVRETLALGYRPFLASINVELARAEWLGRELDAGLAAELAATPGVDPAGERGEFHTFVFDGPRFRQRIQFTAGEPFEREGHRVIELTRA